MISKSKFKVAVIYLTLFQAHVNILYILKAKNLLAFFFNDHIGSLNSVDYSV
jgi:hypothetical protein